jgi:hypothetical protein
MGAALICAEVALAFVLLIGAGLLIQTFAELRGVEKSVAFPNGGPAPITALPGVVSAGFTNHRPLVVKGELGVVGDIHPSGLDVAASPEILHFLAPDRVSADLAGNSHNRGTGSASGSILSLRYARTSGY